jgi:hypothetical protein
VTSKTSVTAQQGQLVCRGLSPPKSDLQDRSTFLGPDLERQTPSHDFSSPSADILDASAAAASSLENVPDGWHHGSPFTGTLTDSTSDRPEPRAATCSVRLQHSISAVRNERLPRRQERPEQYILPPSPVQSIPQTLGASPDLHSLGSVVNGWIRADPGASQSFNVDDATSAWATLLLRDASSRINGSGEAGLELPDPDVTGSLGPSRRLLPSPPPVRSSHASSPDRSSIVGGPSLQDMALATDTQGLRCEEEKPWQSSVRLQLGAHEYPLFHDFIQNLSLWVSKLPIFEAVLFLLLTCTAN